MRTASRSPVTLKIKFKSTTLEQFIERYSVDISHGGIFIRTKEPLPVGTNLRFEFQLKDASPLITGDGTVVWTRDFDATRSGVAPGMGVRFDRLPSESQDVLAQILTHKTAKLGKPAEPGFLDSPTQVSFGNVPTRVTPKEILDGLNQVEARRTLLGVGANRSEDSTPLPGPLPFNTDLDEFPDEAFEEATKVASLEALARRTAEPTTEDNGGSLPAGIPFRSGTFASGTFGRSTFAISIDEADVTVQRRQARTTPSAGEPIGQAPGSTGADGREPARDTSPIIQVSVTPAPAESLAPAPFRELPGRSPFTPGAHDGPEDRTERPERDASAGLTEPRPPQGDGRRSPDADPFSLPSPTGPAGDARRSSRPLHVLDTIPPEGPAAGGAEQPIADRPVGAATRPAAPREASSTPWIAAAAVLLLAGGIGGYWLLSGRPGGQRGKAVRRPASGPVAAHRAQPTDPVRPPAGTATTRATTDQARQAGKAAPVGGLDVTVASLTEGATAELVGGSQSGRTPMTFRGLVAGHTYQVKITRAGFRAASLAMRPDAGDPAPVQLEAKPAVLHVTSEPAGAQVWINGRRQRSLTPANVELPRRLTDAGRFSVSLRMRGYLTSDQQVALDKLIEHGDTMVQELSVALARRPVARPAAQPAGDGAAGAETGGEPAHDGGAANRAAGSGSGAKPDRETGPGGDDAGASHGGGASELPRAPSGGAAVPNEPGSKADALDADDSLPDWMNPE